MPTVAEAGVPGYEFASWYGILVPAGTAPDIVKTLNQYIVKAMRSAEVEKYLAAEGAEVIASSPAQFGGHIKKELARWAEVIKAAGVQAD